MGIAALPIATKLALAATAAGAGLSYVNTRNTQRRADNALAQQIRTQGKHQQGIDKRVNAEVESLAASRADEHRAKALDSYRETLQRGRQNVELDPGLGGEVFRADARQAGEDVQAHADERAGLMARIDAAGDQRRSEGMGYGRLGSDIALLAREAAGDNYLDELRVRRAGERDARLDALSALLGGVGNAMGASGAGAAQRGAQQIAGRYFQYGGLGGLGR